MGRVRQTVGTWTVFLVTSFECYWGLFFAGVWMIYFIFYEQLELRGGECNSEDLVLIHLRRCIFKIF